MPLELGVWRIDGSVSHLPASGMDVEARLESILASNINIASPDLMVVGRQVATPWGKRIDLLAIDRDGNLVVLELKRAKTEREVVAQALDYGSWVRTLRAEDIAQIFNTYRTGFFDEQSPPSIDQAFCTAFGVKEMPEELNERHELVIVGTHFDAATERIVTYLAEEFGVRLNAVFFRVFRDGDREYLTRAWMREPDAETAAPVPARGGAGVRPVVPHPKTDWNGEFYVSFGHDDRRHWEDAREFGFISAGGGAWYSNTLDYLEPGHRVWVNIPGNGYVGVGVVTGTKTRVDKLKIRGRSGETVPILEANTRAKDMGRDMSDPELAEYMVPVRWVHTVGLSEAVREKGFFGNQNSVARPRDAKWAFTVERLKQRFGLSDERLEKATATAIAGASESQLST
jgi:hypothetical protein